ncbi:MAG: ACP S-malonyltransferase [Phycisphaerales bacterium]|nr:ACP S-malonyltransferase [Phycisphaerales bacterium]
MTAPRIILCPGQGAQAVAMAKPWHDASAEARSVFALADRLLGSRLGAPLSELCFSGSPERLNQTDVSQPAIYVASIACWRGLLAQWGAGADRAVEEARIMAAAGLSLGEYTALHLAGAFTFEEGLELVALRGRAMQDAAALTPSGMVALIGADEGQAQAVCDAARGAGGEVLVCANFNAPGQVVLSGSKAACERAVEEAGKAGLRAAPLAVAGAFHSPLMAPAADRLGEALARTSIRAPRCPVLSNVTGDPHASSALGSIEQTIRTRLVEQLTSAVRWSQNCQWLVRTAAGSAAEFHELAPGKTLAGLMKRIDRGTKVTTHEEPAAS